MRSVRFRRRRLAVALRDERARGSAVLVLDEAVGKTVPPTGTPGNTDLAATQCPPTPRGTCADASSAASAQLLTGVENGSEAVARGFPDSLRREQERPGPDHAPAYARISITRQERAHATPFFWPDYPDGARDGARRSAVASAHFRKELIRSAKSMRRWKRKAWPAPPYRASRARGMRRAMIRELPGGSRMSRRPSATSVGARRLGSRP
jgi:hypothetical protein